MKLRFSGAKGDRDRTTVLSGQSLVILPVALIFLRRVTGRSSIGRQFAQKFFNSRHQAVCQTTLEIVKYVSKESLNFSKL
ncbi:MULTISPECIES: hypothetical protein [unclassified Microcoleus]|uniref:hypothetical protein n=1 Tax=unclassified Microcoleus TaxID=2642155 RepID=UPI002FD1DEC2